MGSLLGESDIGDGAANQIHDVFAKLPDASGYTCLIGFTGILLLTILDQAGKRWGKKNKIVWFLSITRAFITLLIYTGVGYAVNKNRDSDDYLFAVVQVKSNGQEPPRVPSSDLIAKVASRSIAVFIGAAVEHTAIARAFGVKNDYVPDQSQELCYFGVANFFNSFFHAMGVGGAMSRTAHGPESERNWSVVAEKRIARLRKRANVYDIGSLPPIGLVILDFGKVNHIDTTAVSHLGNLFNEIRKYGGKGVEIRFVNASDYVRQRFERAGWSIVDADTSVDDEESVTRVYRSVLHAVAAPRTRLHSGHDSEDVEKLEKMGTNNEAIATHEEKV
ncbi:putative sulfate permease protein [Phaeoacremonium minimum UCRPA7]|uniref:Putative sulfate permease protein n=1 Tax=Phaeoacremonium minimum (strain UCR-PA7) TaxID=1286976 RepID=R8BLP0_PHAM7|nr:putative sulfate permease protein [Phaeoacremonium minimum UCRPA7]EOO00195.1 putative sulfate permease protein [Phaeoacremonium minimum UCRPA7]